MKLRSRIRWWWARLWVRADEFHPTLDMHYVDMLGMSKEQKHAYMMDLVRRRRIAHERDLEPAGDK